MWLFFSTVVVLHASLKRSSSFKPPREPPSPWLNRGYESQVDMSKWVVTSDGSSYHTRQDPGPSASLLSNTKPRESVPEDAEAQRSVLCASTCGNPESFNDGLDDSMTMWSIMRAFQVAGIQATRENMRECIAQLRQITCVSSMLVYDMVVEMADDTERYGLAMTIASGMCATAHPRCVGFRKHYCADDANRASESAEFMRQSAVPIVNALFPGEQAPWHIQMNGPAICHIIHAKVEEDLSKYLFTAREVTAARSAFLGQVTLGVATRALWDVVRSIVFQLKFRQVLGDAQGWAKEHLYDRYLSALKARELNPGLAKADPLCYKMVAIFEITCDQATIVSESYAHWIRNYVYKWLDVPPDNEFSANSGADFERPGDKPNVGSPPLDPQAEPIATPRDMPHMDLGEHAGSHTVSNSLDAPAMLASLLMTSDGTAVAAKEPSKEMSPRQMSPTSPKRARKSDHVRRLIQRFSGGTGGTGPSCEISQVSPHASPSSIHSPSAMHSSEAYVALRIH